MKAADLQPGHVYAVREGRKNPAWDPGVYIGLDPDMKAAHFFIRSTEPLPPEKVAQLYDDAVTATVHHGTYPLGMYRASTGQVECLWADFDETAVREAIEQRRAKRDNAKRAAAARIHQQWETERAAKAQTRRAGTPEGRQEARLEELLSSLGVFDSVRVRYERREGATIGAVMLELNQVVFDSDESRFMRLLDLLERCEGTDNA